jgi:hypothetical protein
LLIWKTTCFVSDWFIDISYHDSSLVLRIRLIPFIPFNTRTTAFSRKSCKGTKQFRPSPGKICYIIIVKTCIIHCFFALVKIKNYFQVAFYFID